jgi:transposase
MCASSCAPSTGNSSDQVSLLAAVEALAEQLRTADATLTGEGTPASDAGWPLFVADGGLSSAATMARLSAAGIAWVSRVPATLRASLENSLSPVKPPERG